MGMFANIQAADIGRTITENQAMLDPIRQFIVSHFGQNGLYAAYLLAAAVVVLIFYKLVKLSFEIIFFVILPATICAFVLTFVVPYGFAYLLPATAALFTLGLVLRTVGLSKG